MGELGKETDEDSYTEGKYSMFHSKPTLSDAPEIEADLSSDWRHK